MPGSGQGAADGAALEIAAAVAAESAYMEEVLVRLVEAPTTLGNEEPGQAVMRNAFRELGLDPFDQLLDAEMLRSHPAASPFSWDVSGKSNVIADWLPAGRVDAPRPQRPHRRRCARRDEPLAHAAVLRRARRRLALRSRHRGHEGWARSHPRGREGAAWTRPRAARSGTAPIGRRGGVHRERRPPGGGRRSPGRRVCGDRAVPCVDLDLAGGCPLVSRRHRGLAGARRRCTGGRECDRGVVPGRRGPSAPRGGVERRRARCLRDVRAPDQPQHRGRSRW